MLKCSNCGLPCDEYFSDNSGRPLCGRCKSYRGGFTKNRLRNAEEHEIERFVLLLNDKEDKRLNLGSDLTEAYIKINEKLLNIDLNKKFMEKENFYLLYFYYPELKGFVFDIFYDKSDNSFLCSFGKTKKYETLGECFVKLVRLLKGKINTEVEDKCVG